ncbi:MAG: hypothetical protein M3018_14695 [Actinomycetota bacterium]|nr:hypothetical protein [Actinomycetota bacterium]
MSADPVKAIADAMLYEGYILWPYRRSALKNQRRFTFGGVYPPGHSEAHPDDPSSMQTELLLRVAAGARVQVTLRFLQVVRRTAARGRGEELEPVDQLEVGGERYLTWDEAVERELRVPELNIDQLRTGHTRPIEIAGGREREDLAQGAGALVRTWHRLAGVVRVRASETASDALRLSVEVENTTPFDGGSRELALRETFCSTHVLLHVDDGAFVSMTDPPPELTSAAAACRNQGTWPVLVGEEGRHDTVLSSPIILEDYPRIAPQSPGDLFDGGEIDQLLILNILALTDEEKAEMLASDPRAREILERTETLTPEQLMALHGTVRELGMAR